MAAIAHSFAIDCNFAVVLKWDPPEYPQVYGSALKFDPYHDAQGRFASHAGSFTHAEAFGKAASGVRDALPSKSSIIHHNSEVSASGERLHVEHVQQFSSAATAAKHLEAVKAAYAHIPGVSVEQRNSQVHVVASFEKRASSVVAETASTYDPKIRLAVGHLTPPNRSTFSGLTDQEISAKLKEQSIKLDGPGSDADNVAEFENRTGLDPIQFKGALLDNFKSQNAVRHEEIVFDIHEPGQMHLTAKLELDHAMVTLKRNIDLSNREVEHELFIIHGKKGSEITVQGQGIGKQIFSSSLDLYDHLGVNSIAVHANLDIGGYAWARYGFTPGKEVWNRELKEKIKSRLSSLPKSINETTPGVRVIRKLLESADPSAFGAIAELRDKVVFYGKQYTLGQVLLRGTDWKGSLELSDTSKYAQVRAYVDGR